MCETLFNIQLHFLLYSFIDDDIKKNISKFALNNHSNKKKTSMSLGDYIMKAVLLKKQKSDEM